MGQYRQCFVINLQIVKTVRKKVLVIDDEAIIREIVQSCLEDENTFYLSSIAP
jgi:hypothetical protein